MVDRVRNVIKRDSKKGKTPVSEPSTPKRRRKGTELVRRYPVSNTPHEIPEDAESLTHHKKALCNELAKPKPRETILLPLMKATYGERRIYILNVTSSVDGIFSRYPALSRPAVVSVTVITIVFAVLLQS